MKRWEITETDSSRRPPNGKEVRQAIAGRTKVACTTYWLRTLKGEDPHRPDWSTAVDLTQHGRTHVLPLHLTDHRSNRWYKSQFSPSYRVPAPYLAAMVHLPTPHLRALCTFRLGIARLHVYTGRCTKPPTPLLERPCKYCREECGRTMIEDPYHVCMECPLYERARVDLYTKLQSTGFDFSSATTLPALHIALLSAGRPDTVRSVGRYLADCMATRDTYNNQVDKSQWVTKTNRTLAHTSASEKPTTCNTSSDILRRMGCDVTQCEILTAQLGRSSV
jgi:hypothetical protein